MQSAQLHVVSASAGSGKTYRLVQEYIALALQGAGGEQSFRYRNILAITFTNKAAGEMKDRVFSFLKQLAEGGQDHLAHTLAKRLNMEEAALRKRCGEMRLHMLHHYPDLSIRTIDSFMHTLVRGFARDLHLDPEFEVLVDTRTELAAALDDFLSNIGTPGSERLTEIMRRLAESQTQEEKSWQVREALLKFVQQNLLKEDVRQGLEAYTAMPLDALGALEAAMQEFTEGFEKSIREAVAELDGLFTQYGLKTTDMARKPKDLPGPIVAMREFDHNTSLSKTLFHENKTLPKLLDGADWYPKTALSEVQEAFDAARPQLVACLQRLFGLPDGVVRDYVVVREARKKWLNLSFLREMQVRWQEFLRENALLPVAEFQQRIGRVLAEDPSAFIYERIGQRYQHILIDEFQDTSRSQWQNFLPLVAGALSQGRNSLIVGDGKQSIYRWRGAEAQQFQALSDKRVQLPQTTDDERTIHNQRVPETLGTNWRSHSDVVTFNNRLFQALSGALNTYAPIYASVAQEVHHHERGYVQVTGLPTGKDDPTDDLRAEFILNALQALKRDQFPLEKCALLVRTKKQALRMTEVLRGRFAFTTQETLLLASSREVVLLVDALRWLQDPEQVGAGVRVAMGLQQLRGNSAATEAVRRYRLRGKQLKTAELLQDVFGEQSRPQALQHWRSRTAYEQLEWLHAHLLPAGTSDPYLEFLFENARSLAERGDTSVQHLLDWWDAHKDHASAATQGARGAIQIMTIHKSKGLEFEAVLLPLWLNNGPNTADLWVDAPADWPGDFKLFTNYQSKATSVVPAFAQESELQQLDALNVLYVAATRACRRLYMGVELSTRPADHWNDRLWTALGQLEGTGDDTQWHTGVEEPFGEAPEEVADARPLTWQYNQGQRPVVAYEYRKHWEADHAARWQGQRLHSLLAHLDGRHTADQAIDRHLREGLAAPEERDTLHGLLDRIHALPEAKRWFAPEAQVFCEAELITRIAGKPEALRPDRVVVHADAVEVIDYKSGKPKAADHQQVRQYMEVLREVYTQPVHGYVLYTEPLEAVPVEG